jgi:hypothetical protein
MGNDLVELMENPKAMLDNAISGITQKAATSLWADFKRLFANAATDIFFRKDMGERYFSGESLIGGVALWIIGTAASTIFYFSFSALLGSQAFAGLLILGCLSTGSSLVVSQCILGWENIVKMAKYRADGLAYHTRSRGIPRWGNKTILVLIGMVIVLLVFNIVSAVFFIASCAMSAKLAAEQDAAIYARYLDALDRKIEQEYLESAILGKCPTEITQLSRPLPAGMKAELRTNIAAAAVGKPVTIVAKGPSRAATAPPKSDETKQA